MSDPDTRRDEPDPAQVEALADIITSIVTEDDDPRQFAAALARRGVRAPGRERLDRIARSRVDPYLLINACRKQHTDGANPAVDEAVEAIVVSLFNGDAGAELARGMVVKGSP